MTITAVAKRLALLILALCPLVAAAEDTDLFVGSPPDSTIRPNVLIVLDNTANWNTPFVWEKTALQNVVNALNDKFNVGLMMFTETGNPNDNTDGGYVRFGVRRMTDTNKSALVTLVNNLDKLNDKSNGGKLGKTMNEAYVYFKSTRAYSGFGKVKRDYHGNTTYNEVAANLDGNAFTDSESDVYVSPITEACARNYILYISNGPAQDNTSDTTTATGQLSAAGGNTTPITLSPNGSQSNVGDEWARFLANADISTLGGTQNVYTFTIDVSPRTTTPGLAWTELLKSMALVGKGRYSEASDLTTLTKGLTDAFTTMQSVNSVFAASTLPVSVNVRGSYLNQVYMGVFRPDADAKPRWFGNLKEYQFAQVSGVTTLADSAGNKVEDAASGFIVPGAISYWTTSSTFWNYNPSGSPLSGSDSPDGYVVEKGAAAQRLRTTVSNGEPAYTFNASNRKLYTCTGSCAANSLLSGTPFNSTNVSTAALGAADATERDKIIAWTQGQDVNDENGNNLKTDTRPSIHGDVVHSRPVAINYGGSTGVVLYYGDNGGVFHAVQGGQAASDGDELWGFVPSEFLGKLKRLVDNSPEIDLYPKPEPRANPKPYFVDGPVGVYRYDANNDGQITTGGSDKVYIYLTMRRGGRFIYALDVTDPANPRLLWKKSNSDYAELGQTWSEPKVTKIKATSDPVLIFGAGYDEVANASVGAPTTTTMGRGVFILDALDGAKVWSAGVGGDVAPAGMTYSIASDVALVDRDGDFYTDRVYAVDVGGNIWRLDIGDANKSNWVVNKFASVGGDRRFLFPPDVVFAYGTRNYDSLLIGSGDREHPFDTTVVNRFYMFKDTDTGLLPVGTTRTAITEGQLYDTTSNLIQVGTTDQQNAAQSSLDAANGWYITLGAGEKVVGSSLVVSGTTYFGTNQPTPPADGVCTPNLGAARAYAVSFLDGRATTDLDNNGTLTTSDRSITEGGGGMLPSPTYAGNDKPICMGPHCWTSTQPPLNQRYRTFWFQEIDR